MSDNGPISNSPSSNGHSGNGQVGKVPAPLNPQDPLNAFTNAIGGGRDEFRIFKGLDGVPHRAHSPRPLKENDPEHLRPQPGGQVRCYVYDLGVEEERQAYEKNASRIYTMAQQGKAMISAIERQFSQERGSWLVMFEWIELFTYDPVNPRMGGGPSIRRQH